MLISLTKAMCDVAAELDAMADENANKAAVQKNNDVKRVLIERADAYRRAAKMIRRAVDQQASLEQERSA